MIGVNGDIAGSCLKRQFSQNSSSTHVVVNLLNLKTIPFNGPSAAKNLCGLRGGKCFQNCDIMRLCPLLFDWFTLGPWVIRAFKIYHHLSLSLLASSFKNLLSNSHCYSHFFPLRFSLALHNMNIFWEIKAIFRTLELAVVEGLHAAVGDFNFSFTPPSGARCHQTSIQSYGGSIHQSKLKGFGIV